MSEAVLTQAAADHGDLSALIAEGRSLLQRLPAHSASAVLAALVEQGGAASDAVIERLRATGVMEELSGPKAGMWDEVETLLREGRRLLARLPEGSSEALAKGLELRAGSVADAALRRCGDDGVAGSLEKSLFAILWTESVGSEGILPAATAVDAEAEAGGGQAPSSSPCDLGIAGTSGSAWAGRSERWDEGEIAVGIEIPASPRESEEASLFERLVLENLQPCPVPADAAQSSDGSATAVREAGELCKEEEEETLAVRLQDSGDSASGAATATITTTNVLFLPVASVEMDAKAAIDGDQAAAIAAAAVAVDSVDRVSQAAPAEALAVVAGVSSAAETSEVTAAAAAEESARVGAPALIVLSPAGSDAEAEEIYCDEFDDGELDAAEAAAEAAAAQEAEAARLARAGHAGDYVAGGRWAPTPGQCWGSRVAAGPAGRAAPSDVAGKDRVACVGGGDGKGCPRRGPNEQRPGEYAAAARRPRPSHTIPAVACCSAGRVLGT